MCVCVCVHVCVCVYAQYTMILRVLCIVIPRPLQLVTSFLNFSVALLSRKESVGFSRLTKMPEVELNISVLIVNYLMKECYPCNLPTCTNS